MLRGRYLEGRRARRVLWGEVYQKVRRHHDRHYSAFSRLIRSTYDEAVAQFSDGTVDLLHIDGRHFYEDVKHDFEAWRPKLSGRSVVLFHDTNVRERNFGVFRLWEELSKSHPHFEFLHGHGLGILGVGTNVPEAVSALFTAARDQTATAYIREAYSRLGSAPSLQLISEEQNSELTKLKSELARSRAESESLRSDLTRANVDRQHVQAELGRANTEGERLREELSRATTEGERLRAELSRVTTEGKRLRAELSRATTGGERLRAELSRASTDSERLKAELDWASAKGERLTAELAVRCAEIDGLRSKLAGRIEESERRQAALAQAAADNIQLDAKLAQRIIEYNEMLVSTSWRITKPLRWVGQTFPALARQARRLLRLAWWTLTWQLVPACAPGGRGGWRRSCWRPRT